MATWPPEPFPQKPYSIEHVEHPKRMVKRTEMECGGAKVRKRYSAAPVFFDVEMRLTKAEVDTFETFWETSIDAGATAFTWKHPRTQATCTDRCRIVGEPQYATLSGDLLWRVTFRLEIKPA